jgi:heat-inducible transcriptional repressor
MRGVIGVVGPTRMDYAKITAKLSYMADNLSKLFGGNETGQLPERQEPRGLKAPEETEE